MNRLRVAFSIPKKFNDSQVNAEIAHGVDRYHEHTGGTAGTLWCHTESIARFGPFAERQGLEVKAWPMPKSNFHIGKD